MPKSTDVRVRSARLHFLPVTTRVPLKFGSETLTSVTCARVALSVEGRHGQRAEGWGETPLSVQWVWPHSTPYEARHERLKAFCVRLTKAWAGFDAWGHALDLGWTFQEEWLAALWREANAEAGSGAPMPWLGALVACSAFDLALHDAFGNLHSRPVYDLYGPDHLDRDLSAFLEPQAGFAGGFRGRYPSDYLQSAPARQLCAWHLVGGLDPLEPGDLTGDEPSDGFPVLLEDWIRRDGLTCLKVKLRGTDAAWDHARLVRVGRLAEPLGVEHLSADFNCTVTDPGYVTEILDRMARDDPAVFERLLYVEQPFPYDLEPARIEVRAVSARKPLFLDESAHDWRQVRLGRQLGWTGVALKTCKTQTGALLSACWARAHGMQLMVQDLTNPMLAQIPHVLLASQVGTLMGVETNAMQFYPGASAPEAAVHPGLYQRRQGRVDLSSLGGSGFGYRLGEIRRELPAAAAHGG